MHSFKSLRLILFSVIVLTTGIIIVIFTKSHSVSRTEKTNTLPKDADIAVGKVQHTSTKNGMKEWALEAESAYFSDALKQANLQKISAVFFLKDEREVYLTANQGVLNTESRDIELSGNVVVNNGLYRLEAEMLRYDRASHTLISAAPVKIVSSGFFLNADTVSFDLNAGKALFKGNVKGTLDEKVTF